MLKINEHTIDHHEVEFGVQFGRPEIVIICHDEQEARETAHMAGGTVLARTVYVAEWAEVED